MCNMQSQSIEICCGVWVYWGMGWGRGGTGGRRIGGGGWGKEGGEEERGEGINTKV